MRPNAIILNERVVATNLTPYQQDIYGYGELAGEAKYRDALKAKVEALRADMSHNNGAVAMADAVLAVLNGTTNAQK